MVTINGSFAEVYGLFAHHHLEYCLMSDLLQFRPLPENSHDHNERYKLNLHSLTLPDTLQFT